MRWSPSSPSPVNDENNNYSQQQQRAYQQTKHAKEPKKYSQRRKAPNSKPMLEKQAHNTQ